MEFKKAIRSIHKWLGLTSGLIVFIVSITGCIFCFYDEIKDITRKEYRFVAREDKAYIAPSVLKEKAARQIQGATPVLVYYTARNRSAAVYTAGESGNFWVFYNPYNGKYLATEDMRTDFFIIVEYIHLYLLLPDYIGKHIVAGATIIFIIMLITGIIQWWPKKKSDLKRSFNVKWSAKWRRVNYDWHNVSGMYISLVALVIALTGLYFAYDWMRDAMYYSANLGQGDREAEIKVPEIDSTSYNDLNILAVDKALFRTMQLQPANEMFYVHYPASKAEVIETGAYPHALRFDHQSNYYFHPGTGKLLESTPYNSKSAGLKLVEMDYGIHTGQILGLPGKIMAFIASLVAAALPVTGFVIWYGRRNKKKPSGKKTKKAVG